MILLRFESEFLPQRTKERAAGVRRWDTVSNPCKRRARRRGHAKKSRSCFHASCWAIGKQRGFSPGAAARHSQSARVHTDFLFFWFLRSGREQCTFMRNTPGFAPGCRGHVMSCKHPSHNMLTFFAPHPPNFSHSDMAAIFS